MFWLLALFLTACGVKGPPLPPLPVTPQQSERTDRAQAVRHVIPPAPTPSP